MPSCTRRMFKPSTLSHAILIASLSGGVGTTLLSTQAIAQSTTAKAIQTQGAEYNIPAGNLDQVLNSFAAAAGFYLAIDGSLTNNLSSSGIKGSYTVDAGLVEILSGTGLLARRQPNGSYILQKKGEDTAFILPPIKVVGEVRGTKLAGTIQEVDVSVELLDSERLDRERIIEASDIFLKTPNVTSDGIDSGRISIRGITRSGFAGRGSTSNIYVDGSPVTDNALGAPTNLWDVKQVEVLRGSQSTVQGRNALAGAVVINTADPTFEPEAKFRLTKSKFSTTQAAAAVSGAIIDEQLAGRFSIDNRERDSFIKDNNGKNSSSESLTSRAKLLFRPSALSGFESKLTIEHSKTESNLTDAVRAGMPISDEAFSDFDFFDYETGSLDGDSDVTTTRIISETSYALNDNWLVRGIFTNEETEIDFNNGSADQFTDITNDAETFTSEVRFEFNYESLRGLFGAYYFDSETDFASLQVASATSRLPNTIQPFIAFNPADSTSNLSVASNGKTENTALFGQIEWNITEQFILNAGFRYDREEFSDPNQTVEIFTAPDSCIATVAGFLVGATLPTVDLPCQTLSDQLTGGSAPLDPAPDQSFSAFLPRIGLTYRFNDDHSVSLSYQKGYRAGGSTISSVDTDSDGVADTRQNLEYDPEYLDTIEFSTRNLFLDKNLVANANIFYSKYEDQQITILGDNNLDPFNSRVENAAETTLYGAEFLLDYALNESWNIYASVGYLETEIDDLPFARQGEFQNLAGNELPNAPHLTYTVGASYESASGFYANAAYSYIGEQFSSIENLDSDDFRQAFADAGLNPEDGARFTEVINSRGDLTMTAGYKFNGFNVYAFGSNLLNDESLTWVNLATVNQGSGQIVLVNAAGIPNQVRTYGVGLDYEF